MKRILIIGVAGLTFVLIVMAGSNEKNFYKPENGYIPDKETAISIAIAVWIPIYGKDKIEQEKPYKVTLSNGVWIVKGSLSQPKAVIGSRPKIQLGGVVIAEISKSDGTILRVSHGK